MIIKNILKRSESWFAKHSIYVIIGLIFCFIVLGYENVYMDWYNRVIMPFIANFFPNAFSWIIALLLVLWANITYCKRFKLNYTYDVRIVFGIICILFLIIRARFSGEYDYMMWLCKISYVDLMWFVGIEYILFALINFVKQQCCLKSKKNKNNKGNKESEENKEQSINEVPLLKDWPIYSCNEDIFDLKEEAKKIAEYLNNVDMQKAWSFAITAPWGVGKTSLMNMIIEYVKNDYIDDFDFVQFNPRDCRSYQTIQEEFFMQITCVLSNYDSRCNKMILDYMASLQLIDNRGIIEKWSNFYKIRDKEKLKDNIGKSFEGLSKKILVIVDDFDRLSKEEVLEVLKLIDSNAAFKNLIFLTAYDKNQVNKMLGETYKTDDACFVDKFFNLEFSIPSRPYTYVAQYIIEKLCEIIHTNPSEETAIKMVINSKMTLFKKHISTLRDAKRFVNQVVVDYKYVRGDVCVDEYILVELLKYSNLNDFKKLYNRVYVEDGALFAYSGIYYLKDLSQNNVNSIDILNALFPKTNSQIGSAYHHVFDVQSFDNYFENRIYATLRIKDMLKMFNEPIEDVYKLLDGWLKDDDEAQDVVTYLNSVDIDNCPNGDYFKRYAVIVTYVAIKRPRSRAYWLLLKVLYNNNIDGFDKKYKLDFNEYKNSILTLILNKSIDPLFTLLRGLHMHIIFGDINEKDILIQDADIKKQIFRYFINAVGTDIAEENLKSWLHNCADSMEPNTRRIILNDECVKAYRKHLDLKPDWYIKNFVHLGSVSSNPCFNNIACDGFWTQIFKKDSDMVSFIDKCKANNLEGSVVASNFWSIYTANDYKPIEFQDQGDVQEKINSNLELEKQKLEQLKAIDTIVDVIPNSKDGLQIEQISTYRDDLLKQQELLNKTDLYISLHGKILQKIQDKLSIMK